MSKVKKDYESVRKYTDAELLDMWEQGWSTEQLVKMLHREDKSISQKDARTRMDRITTRWNFEVQKLPVPPMWQ